MATQYLKSPIVLLAERVAKLEHDLDVVTKRLNWLESHHYGVKTEDPQGIWPTNPIQALNLSKANLLTAPEQAEQASIDTTDLTAESANIFNNLFQQDKQANYLP